MQPLAAGTKEFDLDGENFIIDVTPGYHRRPSDNEAYTIVKTIEYLNLYTYMENVFKPKTILEDGVFQGGSFVFFDKLFKPEAISAIKISQKPVVPLINYCAMHERRHVRWGHSQTDATTLKDMVANDLGGQLDLVVDDASHLYSETRTTFETLFPLLSPGGYYIIEDWAWAHAPGYQNPSSPLCEKPALTNLLFDLAMLHGSTRYIDEIRVFCNPCLWVRKSAAATETPENFWSEIRARGRTRVNI